MSKKVECSLSCGHATALPINSPNAVLGVDAYCAFDGWEEVTGIWYKEYRVVCFSCQFARWCGQDKRNAVKMAATHRAARGAHVTAVFYDQITNQGGTPKAMLRRILMQATNNETVELILGSLSDCDQQIMKFPTDKGIVGIDNTTAEQPPPF